jgi:hypothetical protein
MVCFKYSIANACGHKRRDSYIYCQDEHSDNWTSNRICSEKSRREDRRETGHLRGKGVLLHAGRNWSG